jgi:hypothetical protein
LESTQAAADAARRAGQNVREGAAQAYDSTTNTLGTPVKDQDWGYGNYVKSTAESAKDKAELHQRLLSALPSSLPHLRDGLLHPGCTLSHLTLRNQSSEGLGCNLSDVV